MPSAGSIDKASFLSRKCKRVRNRNICTCDSSIRTGRLIYTRLHCLSFPDSENHKRGPWLEQYIHTYIMAPLTPHWTQPSHPEIQQVVIGKDAEFSSKSLSRITVAPLGLYAELTTPPCTFVDASTYATVQAGRDRHILLNSDLLYLNHSCEPSLVSAKNPLPT